MSTITSDHVLKISQAQTILNSFATKADARFLKLTNAGALATKDEVAKTDLTSALASEIEGKADSATTLSGYGITNAYTKTEVDNAIAEIQAGALKPGGTLAASGITSALLVEGNLGKVYNISGSFTSTADFVEGAGEVYPAGTNIYIVDADTTGSSPSYKFDILAGSYGVATTSGNGLMSATDKTKLDGIDEGANAYTHPSYTAQTGPETANATPAFGGTFSIGQVATDSSGHVTGITSRTVTIPNSVASTSAAGLMSAADKTKLDGIEYATSTEVQNVIDDLFAS